MPSHVASNNRDDQADFSVLSKPDANFVAFDVESNSKQGILESGSLQEHPSAKDLSNPISQSKNENRQGVWALAILFI